MSNKSETKPLFGKSLNEWVFAGIFLFAGLALSNVPFLFSVNWRFAATVFVFAFLVILQARFLAFSLKSMWIYPKNKSGYVLVLLILITFLFSCNSLIAEFARQ